MFVKSYKTVAMLAALAFGLIGQTAWAVGTASNTTVTNTVTVDYEVSSVAQTQLSDTVDFLVDNKVDLTVTVAGNLPVVPGQTDRLLTFTVTNTGNTTQGYLLDLENDATSDFAMNNVRIYIEDGTTVGFQSTEDTLYTPGTNAGDLDPNSVTPGDDTMTVYVLADVPPAGGGTAPVNTDTSTYNLLATTTNAGTTTVTTDNSADAWDSATVQVVFAEGAAGPHSSDADNDGQDSAQADYAVTTAALAVNKLQTVVSDGVSVSNPKAIPGATVRYSILLDNTTGNVAATNLDVIDDLQAAEVSYNVNSVTVNGEAINDGATGVGAGAGATVTVTDEGSGEIDRVRVTGLTVPAGAAASVIFTVTID